MAMSINRNKFLAAVSGGPDSMCMLHILKHNIHGVCHINYRKRPTADRDMLIVQQYCKQNKIPFYCLKVSKELLNKYLKRNHNFQNAARLIRYDFFIKCAKKTKIKILLIAHNKDDFLETALMQKQRHSKSLFLGIKSIGFYKDLFFLRPLLDEWKDEILDYCNEKNVPYGIDETNDQLIYERNKIRKHLQTWSISKKQKQYNEIVKYNDKHKNLLKLIDSKYFEWKKQKYAISYFKKNNNKLWEYLIYNFLIENDISNISSSKIKNVIQFINSNNTNKKLRLGNDTYLNKQKDTLTLC